MPLMWLKVKYKLCYCVSCPRPGQWKHSVRQSSSEPKWVRWDGRMGLYSMKGRKHS